MSLGSQQASPLKKGCLWMLPLSHIFQWGPSLSEGWPEIKTPWALGTSHRLASVREAFPRWLRTFIFWAHRCTPGAAVNVYGKCQQHIPIIMRIYDLTIKKKNGTSKIWNLDYP